MRYIALFFAVSFLFSSCSTNYYYSTMNSNNPYMKRDNLGCFVTENDSIAISYGFVGDGGAIKINVTNRSTKPIFVDWANSRIMLDNNPDQSFSYGDYLPYDAEAEYIYAQSSRTRQFKVFDDYKFNKLKGKFEPKQVITSRNTHANVTTRTFTEANSPLFFTSELSIYLDKDKSVTPTLFSQDFYVSEVSKGKSDVSPVVFGISDSRVSDAFYVKHEVGQAFWGTVGAVVLVGLLTSIYIVSGGWENDLEDDDY